MMRFSKFSVFALTAALALILVTSLPQAAASELPPAVTQDASFMNWVNSLTNAAGNDSKYRRIPLDTSAQVNAFTERLHRLYRGHISEDEFRAWVDAEYPGHTYEQNFIIQYLARHGHGNH